MASNMLRQAQFNNLNRCDYTNSKNQLKNFIYKGSIPIILEMFLASILYIAFSISWAFFSRCFNGSMLSDLIGAFMLIY